MLAFRGTDERPPETIPGDLIDFLNFQTHYDKFAPLIEAVMVGRSGTNAISFVRKSEPLPQWKME